MCNHTYRGVLKIAVIDAPVSDLIIGNVTGAKCIHEPHYNNQQINET
jgi:hypothetical protein